MGSIRSFIRHHYRHFNAAVVVDASEAWVKHLRRGGKMFLTMGGAMSTAELGLSVAELIRQDKVHAICCTGANLEEDVFNLVAHEQYERVPNYRDLTPQQELELYQRKMPRVTDTCIPEDAAMRRVEDELHKVWKKAAAEGRRQFPHEYLYELLLSGVLEKHYQIDPKNSWMMAAAEKNLPIWTPGWEDSTLGNNIVACAIAGDLPNTDIVISGLEQMRRLVDWYKETAPKSPMGFFQIGGGISGDFPICVVPLIREDLHEETPLWSYFAQISDSTTSYGSYSGAVPNEKITWGKIGVDTPSFVIESDATIVFPLVAAYVLES